MNVADVLQSPALPLFLELEAAGLVVVTTATGTLRIGPADRLTPQQVAAIGEHRDALKTLALICEDGYRRVGRCLSPGWPRRRCRS